MAFDGLFTKAMTNELQVLKNGRISKIHQPNTQELIIVIRAGGKNHKLLVSIHPSYSRVQITDESIPNPPEPPMFCMVLRKHLEGGVITAVEQVGNDRIIMMGIRAKNEIGDEMQRSLVIEIMGRHSNMLLLDTEKNIIIDSMKHLPPSVNSYRTVMPGQPFIPAPPQDKQDPFTMTKEEFISLWDQFSNSKDIIQSLSGFSRLHADELMYRFDTCNAEEGYEIFQQFLSGFAESPSPSISETKGKLLFSAVRLTHAERLIADYNTLGDLLDKVYFAKAERERVKSQAADLERWLDNEIAKLRLKMKKLKKEQESASRLDDFQLFGELLTANSHAITKGLAEVEVNNYYEEDSNITISLDPRKTAIENAQKYYSRYSKAKNALIMTAEQLLKAEDDINYFEMLKQQVMQASPKDIEEIREELAEVGLMKARKGKKKNKPSKPAPEAFVSSSGIPISVGKNNKQNDYLTFKLAAKGHIWFHTKDIPGSHVVIHSEEPDDVTIQEAALLSAYYSKARDSSSVPVDYTEIRHVKKPAGSKPGFVIYFEQNTLFVTPDEDTVRRLKK